jgi:adenylate cyclase
MVTAPLQTAYRRLGARRYLRWSIVGQFLPTFLAVLGGVWLLHLYVHLTSGQFWRILLVSEFLTAVEVTAASLLALRLVRPAMAWLAGDRSVDATVAAWRALAGLPLAFVRFGRGWPAVANIVPISAFIAWQLGTPPVTSFLAVAAGTAIVLAYNAFLRFFALELLMRPVLDDVSAGLPAGSDLGHATLPLRWKLLIALPATNVITGVVVVGVANDRPGIEALGIGVLVAIVVAFTISFELTLLLVQSILGPIQDLRRGTDRVAAGDLATRVPVHGSDETGRLAASFNHMVAGLQERATLHEAFGAFVAPALAERVLEEGVDLEGEEVEVSVLFMDLRDFTAFAERSSAHDVVARLNDFYERVVPVLVRHGGHANKFVGDGLLGVFGAPERLPDHADRAVEAALDLARTVERAYGDTLRVGIGVNSGPVVAGTIGGGGHIEFTVIGDTVNTAARVEEATRETGDPVLVTGATCRLLRREHGGFADREPVAMKGKTDAVALHVPLALARDLGAATPQA